jgi:hypothetical protein
MKGPAMANQQSSQQSPKYTYELVDPDSIEVVVATEYLIQDFLVANEITFVFGAPKQFKTFLVLAAVLCIAMGIDFFGRKVQQRKVLYVIAEGGDAFTLRLDLASRVRGPAYLCEQDPSVRKLRGVGPKLDFAARAIFQRKLCRKFSRMALSETLIAQRLRTGFRI